MPAGLFARRMILSFHKMTFSQVAHFLTRLQSYVHSVDLNEDKDDSVPDISMDVSSCSDMKEQDSTAGLVHKFSLHRFQHSVKLTMSLLF